MENTKENVVSLLKHMAENEHRIADTMMDSDPELKRLVRHHAMDYEMCVALLTDPEYFNGIWEIYMKEDK